jgi:OOP family OmpA-OmpF porin
MTKVRNAALALASVVALAAPSIGMAQSTMDSMTKAVTGPDSGWYVGGSYGQTKFGIDCSGLSCDDTDTGFRVFGGYMGNKHFGVELGYADLGKSTFSGTVLGVPVTGDSKATAWDLVAVGVLPIGDKFSVFGKLGMYMGDGEFTVTGIGSSSDTTTDLTYGVGVGFDFTKNLGIRAEWQRYQKVSFASSGGGNAEGDVDLMSIGILWRFK